MSNSPNSAINTSKYNIENDGKSIFISTPNFMFEELLDTLFKIAREEQNYTNHPIVRLSFNYPLNYKHAHIKSGWYISSHLTAYF